ncbi:hypothetical protein OXX69_013848, partial [Metschnikowia pulcherrima]
MSAPQDIANTFKKALNLDGGSPNAVSTSPTQSYLSQYAGSQKPTKALKPFSTGDIKILLLENVN